MASIIAVVVSLVLATMVSAVRHVPPYQSPPASFYRPPPPPPPPATTTKPIPYKPEPYKTLSGPAARPYPPLYNSQYQDGSYNGYQRDGYNKQPYEQLPYAAKSPSRFEDEAENDVVDRLFAAADSLYSQLDLAAHSLANLDSQGSLQTKQITQLTVVDLPGLEETNIVQDKNIVDLETKLDVLEKRLSDLEATMDKVESLNAENTKDIKELDIALAKQQYIDSNQVGDIARLLSAAQNVQTQLLIIVKNYFALLGNDIQDVFGSLNAVLIFENSRICETGVTTVTKTDRRSVITFNSDFGQTVPKVLYGISGFRYRFEVEQELKYSQSGYGSLYDKSYGPGYPQYGSLPYRDREAGSVGGLVYVLATTEGLTVELLDQSFDDAETEFMEVPWQVCSIGPGTQLA
ncbi:hypothetical protein C0Q70_07683 [Pomacea canaliculata]|uniref:Uncharacterized protein n=1 Tax=Pomacea canaliculata TaxID=400727 RepID=A0A2T7PFU4_POMCA|nr:uncharacterized protein LOC112562090 [Pomacea canaliculata]PVD32250.1 hypothetical protein C0Q70_07683 [Pomacea canaliculata]